MTWTQDGTRVLLQDGNIWLYNWHSKEGQKIHKDVWIDDVVGWIDETHLLVRAAPTNEFKSGSKILSEDFVLRNKKWGILVVPAAKNYDE